MCNAYNFFMYHHIFTYKQQPNEPLAFLLVLRHTDIDTREYSVLALSFILNDT